MPARSKNTGHLAQTGSAVNEVPQTERNRERIETIIGEGEFQPVRDAERSDSLALRFREHGRTEIGAEAPFRIGAAALQGSHDVAAAGGEIEHAAGC